MGSLDENGELDDPISLLQDNIEVCIGFNGRENSFIPIEDSDSDNESNEIDKEYSSYGNKTFTLPVTFFDVQRNIRLLNECRPLSITVVDFVKYPMYYKKFTDKSSAIEIMDSVVNVCKDTTIVSPVIKTKKEEDILDIKSRNDICVVDNNSERANDIKQDQTGNILYKTDYIITKDNVISEKKEDRFNVEKAGGNKKNVMQVNFKDNDLIDLKVKPRENVDIIVSDNENKGSNIESKQKERNMGPNIEVYMNIVEKALHNFGADIDSDIEKDDKKYKNNNSIHKSNLKYTKQLNKENNISQMNTSQKDKDNYREEKDYSICSNTLSKEIGSTMKNNSCLKICSDHEENNQNESKITNHSSKNLTGNSGVKILPNNVISKTHNGLNLRIHEVQNNTLSPVKEVQDNLRILNPQVISKHHLKASNDISYQYNVSPCDQNSTHQANYHKSNVNNGCNTAQTNSFVTTGNSTQLIYQHSINKHQDGRPIETFISNRSEDLEENTFSVLRTVSPFREKMFYQNCRPTNFSINYKCNYPNNLIHSASRNINCINHNSFGIRHRYDQNYVSSNLYPANYFYNKLYTLPRPPPPQAASPVQPLGMVSSDIKKIPQQQIGNLIAVQEINDVRNFEVVAVPMGYGDRLNNNREELNNTDNSILNRDIRNLKATKCNKQNAIQSILEMSPSHSSKCSTRKRKLSPITALTSEKRKILPHFYKNEPNSNKNLSNIPGHHKGYSPPILPIMPHNKILEMLGKEYKMHTTSSNNINETSVANKEYIHMNHAIKRKGLEVSETRENKSVKKISLEEYKKRSFTINASVALTTHNEEAEEKRNDFNCQNVDVPDLGYDSDSTVFHNARVTDE